MTPPKLAEMPYVRPDIGDLQAGSRSHLDAWRAATTTAERVAVVRAWDAAEIQLDTTRALANVRYQCDTTSDAAKAEREHFDNAGPDMTEMRLAFLREVLAAPDRPALMAELGAHAFTVWDLELRSYQPSIAADRRAEAKLARRYTELTAAIRVPWEGESRTLSQLSGWFGSPDRDVRLRVQQARFAALEEHREELDDIYDRLVRLRDGMARKLGMSSFTDMAYVTRRRDYTPGQVAAFRAQVREVLVPLASRIRQRHAKNLGVRDYAFHDTFVADRLGVPRPHGGSEWMLERAGEMFGRLGADFAEFWSLMRQCDLLDLETREGKAGGGFCTDLAQHGVPFVFANFNGTADDVDVFTHECGHAFQSWRSMAAQPLSDYFSPTADAAEIHSMGLEMLCHPMAELFFEGDADRYRRGHLEKAILFIPYGVAVDEFQHEVYRRPGLSPDQRAELWRDLERKYLPERTYRGMPFVESGRFWQVQRHIYLYPFYYIDYCLAQSCALQFWRLARTDREGAMAAYRRICEVGGSLPFSGIVETAGLKSPFGADCLTGIARDLEALLDA